MNEEATSELPPMLSTICHYCRHQAIGQDDYKQGLDPSGYACSLDITEDEIFRPIAPFGFKGDDYSIDGSRGCEEFEASGLPAHPSIIQQMIANNSLAKTIPIDPKATEEDFVEKMRKYPHVEMGIYSRELGYTPDKR
jgi:hypothetical protein